MLFGAVNIPEVVLEAQKTGRLVIFAGAGVSMSPPSKYPNFRNLAKKIAGPGFRLKRSEPLDRFLGRVRDSRVDVHVEAKRILSNPRSHPNDLHRNIVSLFSSAESLRLVTTNFDNHFTSVAADLLPDAQIYHAPALPRGDDFEGIVYLHGNIEQESRKLILTDEDFGRAYLSEGWATEFLRSLFNKYTVVFVGYSHEDPTMYYLGRGLPASCGERRFALTSDERYSHWKALRIEPIHYSDTNRHAQLRKSVERWADLSGYGALDHEKRIKEILGRSTLLDEEESSYLEAALKDPVLVRSFTAHAKGTQWLQWAEEKGAFTSLFSRTSDTDEPSTSIIEWFATRYVSCHPYEALGLIERQGPSRMHPNLWDKITQHLAYSETLIEQNILFCWLNVMLHPAYHGHDTYLLFRIFGRYKDSLDPECALTLFRHLIHTHLTVRERWIPKLPGYESIPPITYGVSIVGPSHELAELWEQYFKPNLDRLADLLEPILFSALISAHAMLGSTNNGNSDSITWSCESVNDCDSSQSANNVEILVIAIRDLMRWNAECRPSHAQYIAGVWALSQYTMVKRIALDTITHTLSMQPAAKIQWLLERFSVYDRPCRVEIAGLLTQIYPNASTEVRAHIVDVITADTWKEQGVSDQDIYNLVYWLHKAAPDCDIAMQRFQEMHTRLNIEPMSDPYVRLNGMASFVGRKSPQSAEDLLKQVPSQIIDWLLSYQDEGPISGHSRGGLLLQIEYAVAQSFDWAMQLALALRERNDWDADLWPYILTGWSKATLTEPQWRVLLSFIRHQSELHRIGNSIARFLQEIVEGESKIPLSCLPYAEWISFQIWRTRSLSNGHSSSSADNWLQDAINHPGGWLMEFWIQALYMRFGYKGNKWRGIPKKYSQVLLDVIADSGYSAEMARVVLAARLYFICSLDREFTFDNVIPLLDWRNGQRSAQQAWHGFLTWGRPDDDLLTKLMPMYIMTFPYVSGHLGGLGERFSEHLVNIAIYSSRKPLSEGWLVRFLHEVETKDKVALAKHICHALSSMDERGIRRLWKKWLRRYWVGRIGGTIRLLETEEWELMSNWLAYLKPVFPEAVDSMKVGKLPEIERTSLYYRLTKGSHAKDYPEATADLLLSMLRKAKQPFHACNYVEELVHTLHAANVQEAKLRGIAERLLMLRCRNAQNLADFLHD